MKISRRDFVAYSSGLLSSVVPFLNDGQNSLLKVVNARISAAVPSADKNILVVIHLAGGNDWFNTIIPYKDKSYYADRPSLGVPRNTVLRLNEQFALHPNMDGIKELYDRDEVAVLLNSGHSQKILSHHKAIDNMQYARYEHRSAATWQGYCARHVEQSLMDRQILPVINVEPKFLVLENNAIESEEQIFISSLAAGNKFNLDSHYCLNESQGNNSLLNISIDHLSESHFVDSTVRKLSGGGSYGNTDGFSRTMNAVANWILSNSNAVVYHISLGGFDTHANQSAQHAHLLSMLSRALLSFQNNLEKAGVAHRVLTLVCSEFGRSYRENESLGTDHSSINHVLAIGQPVTGGIYGNDQLFKQLKCG